MLSPWMLRQFHDQNQKFVDPGLTVYLRTKNQVVDTQEYVEFGFQLSASGATSGFTDTEIYPPPAVHPMSMHDIGLNAANLMFGAHEFSISGQWVDDQMAALGYTDPYQVFRDPSVIGVIYNNRLFSLDSITTESQGNVIIYWQVAGNMQETKVVVNT